MTTTTTDLTQDNEVIGPIPPSEFPKQYRAIGLLQGKYVPGEDFTRGTLITSDGTNIDAVILGKVLGLVKSARIDLEKEHLWVVYPRTRDRRNNLSESGAPLSTDEGSQPPTEKPEDQPYLAEHPVEDEPISLHVQVAGIWEPETLHPDAPAPPLQQKPDYFSIQGEVVYQNKEAGWVMVKIIQFSARKPDEKPPYFNLKLLGFLPELPVKNFWSLHVQREGSSLVIQDGEKIAYLGKKKPKKGPPKKKKAQRGSSSRQHPSTATTAPAVPKEPPLLKKKQPAGSSES